MRTIRAGRYECRNLPSSTECHHHGANDLVLAVVPDLGSQTLQWQAANKMVRTSDHRDIFPTGQFLQGNKMTLITIFLAAILVVMLFGAEGFFRLLGTLLYIVVLTIVIGILAVFFTAAVA